VQAIGTVVGGQGVDFAIEAQSSVLDAVGSATNGLAKVWCVLGLVEVGGWKAEDDVPISDEELLDCGTLREKGEG